MNIIFLTLDSDTPSKRFRVDQYLPYLKNDDIKFKVYNKNPQIKINIRIVDDILKFFYRTIVLLRSMKFDIVFLQKPGFIIASWFLIHLLFILNKKVIFDFDDAIFIDPQTDAIRRTSELKKIKFILSKSSLVIVGNSYLANFVKEYNRNVIIIPTPINMEKYQKISRNYENNIPVIGWMGTKGNLTHIFNIKDVFKELKTKCNIIFKIVSDGVLLEEFNEAEVDFKRWSEELELKELNSFDIGIMPIENNSYTKGKCGFKLLQYMAVELPVIASAVGLNKEIIDHNINGFLVYSDDEWVKFLLKLCRDSDMRKRMGIEARKKIREKYSLHVIYPKFLAAVKEVYKL